MGFIYKCTDLNDDVIKYVGIIWSKNRTLEQRLYEHLKKDTWCWNVPFKIEFIEDEFSRTDAEFLEAHYISLYGTDKYFNHAKANWGTSKYISDRKEEWKYFGVINSHILDENIINLRNEVEQKINQKILYMQILEYMKRTRVSN